MSFGHLAQKSLVSCLSIFSKGFSSKTTQTILSKLHMQPPCKGVKKVYIFGPGHVSKMAAMLIFV